MHFLLDLHYNPTGKKYFFSHVPQEETEAQRSSVAGEILARSCRTTTSR